MGVSELQKQLARLRERPGVQGTTGRLGGAVPKKKERWVASILYEPKEALAQDVHTLHRRAVDAFDTLSSTWDPDVLCLSELFSVTTDASSAYLRKKRGFLTEKESAKLDNLLNRFLDHIGRYWQQDEALVCLEYVIRQYEAHRYNVDALLSMALPYHDTALFVRLVKIIELPKSSPFLFLNAVSQNGLPLKRSVFVENCMRNPALLAFLSSAVTRTVTELSVPNIPLISFFTLCCVEIIASPNFQPSEQFIRQFIPCIFFSLQNPLQRELHLSGLCILSHLSKRVSLSGATCSAAVSDIFLSILKRVDAVSLRQAALSDSFVFLNLLILEQTPSAALPCETASSTGLRVIPRPVLQQFVKPQHRRDIIPVLKSIAHSKNLDITPVVGVLFRSIFEELARIGDKTDGFKRAAQEFSLELLGVSDGLLSTKVRVAICLTVYEAFLTQDPQIYGLVPGLVLQTLENRYPATVTTALRALVAMNPAPDVLRRIMTALCTVLDDASVMVPLSDPLVKKKPAAAVSDDHRFSLCCALTDQDTQVRLQAVRIALSRFEKTVASNKATSRGADILSKVLLDRASDIHLPIAMHIFQCTLLWTATPPSDTLSQLFYQFYLLARQAAPSPPWMLKLGTKKIGEDQAATSLFPYLVASSSEVQQRLVCVLASLVLVLEAANDPALIYDVFTGLRSLLLPLAWGLCDRTGDGYPELRGAVCRLLWAVQRGCGSQHSSLSSLVSALKAPSGSARKNRSKSLPEPVASESWTLNQQGIALALLEHTTGPVPQRIGTALLSEGLPSVQDEEGSAEERSSALAPLSDDALARDYRLGHVTVVSVAQNSSKCPTVQLLSGQFLGGAWIVLAWIEALTYVASVAPKTITHQQLRTGIQHSWNLWHTIKLSNAQPGDITAVQEAVSRCVRRCLTLVASESLFYQCIYLLLMDLGPSLETSLMQDATLQKREWLPMVVSIFGSQRPGTAKHPAFVEDMAQTSSLFHTIARKNAARVLGSFLAACTSDAAVQETVLCTSRVAGVVVGSLLDDDPDVRKAALGLLKPLVKYIKKRPTPERGERRDVSPPGWGIVAMFPSTADAAVAEMEREFAFFDPTLLLRALLRQEATIALTSAQSCLELLIEENGELARFLALTAASTYVDGLASRLRSALRAADLNNELGVLVPLWRWSLRNDDHDAAPQFHKAAQDFADLLADREQVPYEVALPICEGVLVPYLEEAGSATLPLEETVCRTFLIHSLVSGTLKALMQANAPTSLCCIRLLVRVAMMRDGLLPAEKTPTDQTIISFGSLLVTMLQPQYIVAVIKQSSPGHWGDEQRIKEMMLLLECATASFRDDRAGEWTGDLYDDLLETSVHWMKTLPSINLTQLQSVAVSSLLRCLGSSVAYRGFASASARVLAAARSILESVSTLLVPSTSNESGERDDVAERSAELCVGLMNMTTSFVTVLRHAPSSPSQSDAITELVEVLSRRIVGQAIRQSARLVLAPAVASSLRSTIASLSITDPNAAPSAMASCANARTLAIVNNVVPPVVTFFVDACCTVPVGESLDTTRMTAERDRLSSALTVLCQGFQTAFWTSAAGVDTDGAAVSVAYLLFAAVWTWAEAVAAQPRSSDPWEERLAASNTAPPVVSERWILSVCSSVLMSFSVEMQREVLRHCISIMREDLSRYREQPETQQRAYGRVYQLFDGFVASYKPKTYYTVLLLVAQRVLQEPSVQLKSLNSLPRAGFESLVARWSPGDDASSGESRQDAVDDREVARGKGSDGATETEGALFTTAEWVTCLLLSLLAVASKKNKKRLDAVWTPLSTTALQTATELVEKLTFPLGPVLLIAVATHRARDGDEAAPATTLEERCQREPGARITTRLCRLLAQRCFTPRIVDVGRLRCSSSSHRDSADDDGAPERSSKAPYSTSGIQLLSGRKVEVASRSASLLSSALEGLLACAQTRLARNDDDVWHLVACLVMTFGSAVPSVIVARVVPVVRSSLMTVSAAGQQDTLANDAWCSLVGRVLNPLLFAVFHALPSAALLPELNLILKALTNLWRDTMANAASPHSLPGTAGSRPPLPRLVPTLLTSVGIAFTSPSRCYLSSYVLELIQSVLLHPSLLVHMLTEASSATPFTTIGALQTTLTCAPPEADWFPQLYGLFTSADDHPRRPTTVAVSTLDLWRHVSCAAVAHPNFNSVVDALVSCITAEAKGVAAHAGDWSSALRCAVALGQLNNAVRHQNPDTVAAAHKQLATALVSGVHGAVGTVYSRIEQRVAELSATLAEPLVMLREATYLATHIQSGSEVQFLGRQNQHTVLSSLGHLASVVDASVLNNFAGREYAFLEVAVIGLLAAWLPKMTNAQLQPLLKSLLKYAAHGRPVLMADACPPQSEGQLPNTATVPATADAHAHRISSNGSNSAVALTFRDGASARLFALLFATVAWELEDLGILSCLWDVAPHLKEALIQCQRNAFQLAMWSGSQDNTDAASLGGMKKKKKMRLVSQPDSLSTSWWWFDVGVPILLCLAKMAQVAPSVPLVDQFFPLVVDSLDLFSLLPCPVVKCAETDVAVQPTEASLGRLSHTWLWCIMSAAQHLTSFILEDTMKIRAVLQPLLKKVQVSRSAHVRYCGVVLLYHLWASHGLGLLGSLTDSLQVFVELLEDNDERVERVASLLVKRIERLTGETLQSRLGR